jgi:hypothetical protein
MPDPRSRVRGPRPWLALLFLMLASTASAQNSQLPPATPSLIGSSLFAFPGGFLNPVTATSAGRAVADAWLGESPYGNPAAPIVKAVEISGQMSHISRQDLRATNHEYDETWGFFSGGGLAGGVSVSDRLGVWVYASRPESRFEENAFAAGTASDPSVQPAVVQSRSEATESRAGAGVSAQVGAFRLGIAVENTWRSDRYQYTETSGAPSAGTRDLAFDGDAIGVQGGVYWASHAEPRGKFEVGAAVKRLTELEVTGTEIDRIAVGDTIVDANATREAGWEGGGTVAYGVSESFRVMGGFGGRTAQAWEGFGVTSGAWIHWAIAADYHHPAEPWGLHFGFGGDQQDDVPEESATAFGIAGDWAFGQTTLTVSAMRRSLDRDDAPKSWDTRFMAGVRATF